MVKEIMDTQEVYGFGNPIFFDKSTYLLVKTD